MPHTPTLHRLSTLIAAHERYWAAVAQRNPHSAVVRAFLHGKWDPYYRRWMGLALDANLADNARAIADLLVGLNHLRADAVAAGMSLPPELGAQPLVGAAEPKLLEIAHAVAPATIVELTTEMSGPMLVVRACINGKCYEGAADLSHVLAELRAAGAEYHKTLHAQAGMPLASQYHPLIGASVEAIAGSLIDQHQQESVGSWWSSVKHAASSVEHGAQGTLKALGPEITMAATMAASAALGPEAAPYAAKLTGALVSAANGQGGAAAKQILSAAESAAATNPQIAQALTTAKSTVAKATAAYHVAQTVSQAAQGNPQAQAQVKELAKAAVDGDPAAAAAMQTVTSAYDQISGDGGDASADPSVNGWHTGVGNMAVTEATIARQQQAARDAYYAAHGAPNTFGEVADYMRAYEQALGVSGEPQFAHVIGVGVTINSARDRSIAAAGNAQRAPAYIYVETTNGAALSPMPSLDDAADRYGALDKHAITYAAIFDPSDPTWPEPISDEVGEVVRASVPAGTIPRGVARVSGCRVGADSPLVGGWPALALAALAGGAAGRFGGQGIDWLRAKWDARHVAPKAG
jgi:hypothetical protein